MDRYSRDMRRMQRDYARGGRRMGRSRDTMMREGNNPHEPYGDYAGGRRMMRDSRNPYGSAGGYVTSRRGGDYGYSNRNGSDYGEYNHGLDYADYDYNYGEDGRKYKQVRESWGNYGNSPFYVKTRENFPKYWEDNASDYHYGEYPMMYDMRNDYNDYNYGDYGRYGMDFADKSKLSSQEIEEWVHKLTNELDQEEKELFKMEKVIKKAEEMGEKFDKYKPEELYVATIMVYTDYKNRIGKNLDMSIGLAKDFLCDPDAKIKYGEKLATYYDEIVEGN